MTDLVAAPAAVVERVWTQADDSRAEFLAASQDVDPWVKAEAWKRRWLRTFPAGTQEQYERAWRCLIDFARRVEKPPLVFTRYDVERWADELRRVGNLSSTRAPKPLGDARVKWMLDVVSSFYAYCLEDEDTSGVQRNPVTKSVRPRLSGHSTQTSLTREHVRAVLAAADEDGGATAALMGLLVMGLRISEACENAHIEKIRTLPGIGDRVITVRRKRHRIQDLPIPDPQWERIAPFIGKRRTGPIMLNGDRPMDRRKGYEIVKGLAEHVVPGVRVTPHTFRHAVATHLLEDGVPIHVVQVLLGHESPNTTLIYWTTRSSVADSPLYDLAATYYGPARPATD